MNERLVYIPISYAKNYQMSANVVCDNDKGVELYLKNAFVALKSVQRFNTSVDVAMVVNFDLSPYFSNLFNRNGIKIYRIDFDEYQMPNDFQWSLAFFKIAALKYIVQNTEYEYTLQLESDEICLSNFDDLWLELDSKILTIYGPFRVDHPSRQKFTKLYKDIYGDRKPDVIVNKTGAGFIAGTQKMLEHFVQICDEIYDFIKANIESVDHTLGDELYTSLYCALYPENVGNAAAYASVYWTSSFYLVSTNYLFDPVSIVHLPSEKNRGFITIFDRIIKDGKLPDNKKIFRIMRFPRIPFRITIKSCLRNILSKIKER